MVEPDGPEPAGVDENTEQNEITTSERVLEPQRETGMAANEEEQEQQHAQAPPPPQQHEEGDRGGTEEPASDAEAPLTAASTMDPDHPLLQRAQRLLKQQLQTREAALEGELREKRNELKVLGHGGHSIDCT